MNYAQCGDEKKKNKIQIKSTLVITDISRCFKGHTNKLKYVIVFILQNNTYTLWKNYCSFSRDLAYGTRWASPPFCKFVFIINDVTLLWTTTVLSDKLCHDNFCICLKFQSCQMSSGLDLLMRPAGIVCQWTQTPVSRIHRTSFQSFKIHEFRNERKLMPSW